MKSTRMDIGELRLLAGSSMVVSGKSTGHCVDSVAFLMALGVSVLLQSIERFTEPAEITNPVLVMAVGAAGVASNVVMLLALGGKTN